jgi:hypothetical protein
MAAITPKSSPLADDRLVGVAAIAAFRNERRRRTQYLIDTGRLQHGRDGRVIVASKRVLLAHSPGALGQLARVSLQRTDG